MTGYHISIGYLSGGKYDKEEAWEILKQVVLELCNAPADRQRYFYGLCFDDWKEDEDSTVIDAGNPAGTDLSAVASA